MVGTEGEVKLGKLVVVLIAHLCPTLCDPTDCSPPGFSVMGLSRQEYRSGLPFPSAGGKLRSTETKLGKGRAGRCEGWRTPWWGRGTGVVADKPKTARKQTQGIRVWASSGSWWWRGKPGMLQSVRWQSLMWLSDWRRVLFSLLAIFWLSNCAVMTSLLMGWIWTCYIFIKANEPSALIKKTSIGEVV